MPGRGCKERSAPFSIFDKDNAASYATQKQNLPYAEGVDHIPGWEMGDECVEVMEAENPTQYGRLKGHQLQTAEALFEDGINNGGDKPHIPQGDFTLPSGGPIPDGIRVGQLRETKLPDKSAAAGQNHQRQVDKVWGHGVVFQMDLQKGHLQNMKCVSCLV